VGRVARAKGIAAIHHDEYGRLLMHRLSMMKFMRPLSVPAAFTRPRRWIDDPINGPVGPLVA
jgi:hypothetical protein